MDGTVAVRPHVALAAGFPGPEQGPPSTGPAHAQAMPGLEAPSPGGRSRRSRHRGTLSLLALGAASLLLLVWTRRIDQRRAEGYAVVNAVMELRVRAAMGQLWTERPAGVATARAQGASLLRDSVQLSNELATHPPDDPAARTLTGDLRRVTEEWAATREPAAFERVQAKASELERVIEARQAADIARARSLFPGLLVAWAAVVGAAAVSLYQRERTRIAAEDALRAGQERLENLVEDRTKSLRAVHMELLAAQETERKRISTELHDQLGHALILLKFRIALIARELKAAQDTARRECAELCAFIDQTLDDVRRLARDLRPSVLEELGLSAGLRWMADNCGHDEQRVSSAVDDVDALVPEDAQIVVYRIVQQALTNAARHALAESVSLRVTSDGRCVWFIVEDDGDGFDAAKLASGAAAGALGLTTMQERASIIGGSLDVWSAPGSGTRVTLGVPVPSVKETT